MKSLILITVSVLSAISCGESPTTESTAQVVQAQNHGQICQGEYGGYYNPFNRNQYWPMHGWCQWMPGPDGYDSFGCNAVVYRYDVQIYNQPQPARHSDCANLHIGTRLTFPWLAFNGWNTRLQGVPKTILGVEAGPRTQVQMYEGAFYNGTSFTVTNCGDEGVVRGNPTFEVSSIDVKVYFGECN